MIIKIDNVLDIKIKKSINSLIFNNLGESPLKPSQLFPYIDQIKITNIKAEATAKTNKRYLLIGKQTSIKTKSAAIEIYQVDIVLKESAFKPPTVLFPWK